jgi:hypothetical protein
MTIIVIDITLIINYIYTLYYDEIILNYWKHLSKKDFHKQFIPVINFIFGYLLF